MQCLDFDWIFNTYIDDNGKQKSNALALLRLLADNGHNSKLYKQNSIRIFLSMLWSKYQPMIMFYKFVPFLINLICQNVVTLLGADLIYRVVHDVDNKIIGTMSLSILYGGCIIIELYWFANTWSELKEWCRDGIVAYLGDPWNYLDISITILTQVYMFAFI